MKKAFAIMMLVVLCLPLAGALAQGERVFDRAELFTPAEEKELNQQIAQFQQDTGMDFVIVTSNEEHGNASQVQIADEFYDRGGFGLDDEKSGICYYIDMYERYHYLSTTGAMIDHMTDERIDDAISRCTRYLSAGNYADGASAMIDIVAAYVRKGIPEGQFRYDVVTGQVLTSRHKALTSGEILGSVAIGLVVCLIFVLIVQSRYKLKGSTYHYDYTDNGQVKITDSDDTYLRTTTTRTRKPDPPKNNGGFGGGGFSGGSGVHTSSGGGSHGGGGGHF